MNANIDWRRDNEGKPLKVASGAYILVKDGNTYFAIHSDSREHVLGLLAEMQRTEEAK